eukprot:jgi/Tetstr1/455391/TSEL_042223.t1
MVSDAAKKKAKAKREAAASKRAAAGSGEAAPSGNNATGPAQGAPDGILLPSTLTARQRAALHEAAEKSALQHVSKGEGDQRRMAIGRQLEGANIIALPDDATFTDAELAHKLQTLLGLEVQGELNLRADQGAAKPIEMGFQRRSKKGKAPGPLDPGSWAAGMTPLLEMELPPHQVEEARESISARSSASAPSSRVMLNLKCTGVEGGLLGRSLITLAPNKILPGCSATPLPPHKFSPHDIVAIRSNKGDPAAEPIVEGVVYRIKDTEIVVAVEELPDDGLDVPLRLERLANDITFKRYSSTLQSLSGGQAALGPASRIVDVLFGRAEPRFHDKCPPWTPMNKGLDESQKRAVSLVLAAQDVSLIHGPPGTGKTTAAVEIILQEVKRGSRVLVAAASNIAVDNIVERLKLAAPKLKAVRMGHPARLMPEVLSASLEAQDIKKTTQAMMKLGRKDYQERRALRQELRQLVKEERQRQTKAVYEVLNSSQVVCCTLSGVHAKDLRKESFDLAVVDEAAQALEVATWAAILKAKRVVLAGDHLQLPPTIISKKAEGGGLGRTLFQRLQEMYGESVSEMLTVQYRMNNSIMQWSSDEFYSSKLTAAPSVAQHTLSDIQARRRPPFGLRSRCFTPSASELPVLMMIDTTGCDCEEQSEEAGDSRCNEGEAKIVMACAARLVELGVAPAQIGVITPYNGQVALLKTMRSDELSAMEISSVDGFQGREKEALIISAVRSNSTGEIGFLSDQRRMNVAVTRARRHCCLICCSETLQSDPFLQRLVEYFEANGEYLSAESFM